jgi:hypothetical protein
MIKLCEPGVDEFPYFLFCRELGVGAVNDMVRGRMLELRWMETVPPEHPERSLGPSASVIGAARGAADGVEAEYDQETDTDADASTVSFADSGLKTDQSRSRSVVGYRRSRTQSRSPQQTMSAAATSKVVGPKLVPLTPIMKYAMRDVVLAKGHVGDSSCSLVSSRSCTRFTVRKYCSCACV